MTIASLTASLRTNVQVLSRSIVSTFGVVPLHNDSSSAFYTAKKAIHEKTPLITKLNPRTVTVAFAQLLPVTLSKQLGSNNRMSIMALAQLFPAPRTDHVKSNDYMADHGNQLVMAKPIFKISNATLDSNDIVQKPVCPNTKLSGRNSWPNGPARTLSMVPARTEVTLWLQQAPKVVF